MANTDVTRNINRFFEVAAQTDYKEALAGCLIGALSVMVSEQDFDAALKTAVERMTQTGRMKAAVN
jgi:hypothetical protein